VGGKEHENEKIKKIKTKLDKVVAK